MEKEIRSQGSRKAYLHFWRRWDAEAQGRGFIMQDPVSVILVHNVVFLMLLRYLYVMRIL